jgi:hypothetical protein
MVIHDRIAMALGATSPDLIRSGSRKAEHGAAFRFSQMLFPCAMALLTAAIVVVRARRDRTVFRHMA